MTRHPGWLHCPSQSEHLRLRHMSDINDMDRSASNLPKHKRFASRYHDLLEVSPQKSKAMRRKEAFFGYHDLPKVAHKSVSSFSIHIRQDDDCYNSLLESKINARDSGVVSMPLLENKSVDCLSLQTPSINSIETTPSTFEFQFPSPCSDMNEQKEYQEDSSVETMSIASSIDESDIDDEVEFQTAVPRTVGRSHKAQLVSISSKAFEANLCGNENRRAEISSPDHESTPRASAYHFSSPLTPRSSNQLHPNDCHRPSACDRPLPSLPSSSSLSPPITPTYTAATEHKQHIQHSRNHSPTELISPLSRPKPNHKLPWVQTDGRAESPCLSPAISSPNLYLRSEESNSSRCSLASRSSKSEWRGSGLRSLFSARRLTRDSEQPRHQSEGSSHIFPNPAKSLARRFSPAGQTNATQNEGRKPSIPRIAPVTRVWSDSNVVAQEHLVQHSPKRNFSFPANAAPSVTSLSHFSGGATSAASSLSSSPVSSTTSARYRASVQEERQRSQSLAEALMRSKSVRFLRSKDKF